MKFKDNLTGETYETWEDTPCNVPKGGCGNCLLHTKYDDFTADVMCSDIVEYHPEAARLLGFEPIPDVGETVPKTGQESETQPLPAEKATVRQAGEPEFPPVQVGQHIPLAPGILSIDDSGEGSFFTMTKKMVVEFAKSTDQALINAIIAKAKAEGVTDLYVLDDEFILAAIREKIEREGHENEESNRAGL